MTRTNYPRQEQEHEVDTETIDPRISIRATDPVSLGRRLMNELTLGSNGERLYRLDPATGDWKPDGIQAVRHWLIHELNMAWSTDTADATVRWLLDAAPADPVGAEGDGA